ncbi:hypothetical protein, partial [Mesorhizobium sp. M4A.F.Ca.ET.020.02.1.1]|uniref:hypothetical protein n=1 Tax=Mesorhizobium sp. M4A.F.Ca.ET.020.02.1.1 TaxID=2496652 RepID=UPI001AECB6D4
MLLPPDSGFPRFTELYRQRNDAGKREIERMSRRRAGSPSVDRVDWAGRIRATQASPLGCKNAPFSRAEKPQPDFPGIASALQHLDAGQRLAFHPFQEGAT